MSAKDKSYYWNENLSERKEVYSRFLNEGEFEEWQKYIDLKPGTLAHLEQSQKAQKNYVNALWKLNRFTKFGSKDWHFWNVTFQLAYHTLIQMENTLSIINKIKSDGFPVSGDMEIQLLPEIVTPCETIPQDDMK